MVRPLAVIAVFGALALSACVSAPDDIPPAYVSDAPYRVLNCDELNAELLNLVRAYNPLYAQQANARTIDVFPIPLPVSRIAGLDRSEQIAQIKGQREAVKRVMEIKGCAEPGPEPLKPAG